ncbi:MAG: sugar-binding transcriptional regulator [Actinomycetales bacterium]|nr:sugar-binding transcriptional regulator [Actinomycetales bacterium]
MASSRGTLDQPSDQDRYTTVVRAAWLYYKDNLTQAEIAERLFVSRATVGRLLDIAREEGIVRFEISADHLSALELSTRLRDGFGLLDAVVVPRILATGSPDQVNGRVAAAAAEYLGRFLRPGAVIGVGWGDTVLRVLFALSRYALDGVTIASVAGGIDVYTREVTARNTNGVNEHLRAIPAPLLASSAAIAEALREDASVRSVLALASQAVATLTGIGSADVGTASAVRAGLYTAEEVVALRAAGGVGDMLGEWFDRSGAVVPAESSGRRIGITLDELRALPNVIGVAGGVEKTDAIAGALRGRYLDVLVTDEGTAEALLTRTT